MYTESNFHRAPVLNVRSQPAPGDFLYCRVRGGSQDSIALLRLGIVLSSKWPAAAGAVFVSPCIRSL